MERKLIRIATVAKALDTTHDHIYRLARENKIPGAVRVGRFWRFDEMALRNWIDNGCPMPSKSACPDNMQVGVGRLVAEVA
jgi:excisionase family DNA binding protein